MASIRERATKNGISYEVRWYRADGKPDGCVVYSRPEADRLKVDIERQVRAERAAAALAGVAPADLPLVGATFRTVAEERLALMKNPETRLRTRRRLACHIYPIIGDKPIGMPPKDVAACIASWTGQAPSTRVTLYRTITPIFTYACDHDLIRANPVNSQVVKDARPRPPKRKIHAWEDKYIPLMWKHTRDDAKIFPLIGAYCGLRQGEIFGLGPDEIGFNEQGERVIFVRRQVCQGIPAKYYASPKYREWQDDPREAPLPDFLWNILKDHSTFPVTLPLNRQDGSRMEPLTVELYLVTKRLSAWEASTFNKTVWRPALEQSGLPAKGNGSHSLRHWFAKNRLENGSGIPRLSEWMGHSDRTTTMNMYGRFDPSSEFVNTRVDDAGRELLNL